MTIAALTELKRIKTDGGEVLRALRSDEPNFLGVQEAYFSVVNPGSIRGWKLHKEMTVNAVVPAGMVKFVIVDNTGKDVQYEVYDLGPDHIYGRLSIPPGNWFAFMGGPVGGVVLNLANILHVEEESMRQPLDAYKFEWTQS